MATARLPAHLVYRHQVCPCRLLVLLLCRLQVVVKHLTVERQTYRITSYQTARPSGSHEQRPGGCIVRGVCGGHTCAASAASPPGVPSPPRVDEPAHLQHSVLPVHLALMVLAQHLNLFAQLLHLAGRAAERRQAGRQAVAWDGRWEAGASWWAPSSAHERARGSQRLSHAPLLWPPISMVTLLKPVALRFLWPCCAPLVSGGIV